MEDHFPHTLAVPKTTGSGEDHEEEQEEHNHDHHHHDHHHHDHHHDPHHHDQDHHEEGREEEEEEMDLEQQIHQGSTTAAPEAANEVQGEVGEDDELAEDPYYKEDEVPEGGEGGEGEGAGGEVEGGGEAEGEAEEEVKEKEKVKVKESRKRKRAQKEPEDKDKDDDPPKPAAKKKDKVTDNVTGADCKCKRFKCFQEKTTADDRQVIISIFNNLGEYSKQQAYLAMQIEIGGIAPPKEESSKRHSAVGSSAQNEGGEGGEGGEEDEENKQPSATTGETEAEAETTGEETAASTEITATINSAEASAEGNSLDVSQNASVDASLDTSQVDASMDTSADLSVSLVDELGGGGGEENDNDNENDNENDSLEISRSPTYKKHAYTVKYFVKLNSTRIRVCQKAFCSIFGVSSKRINLLTHKLHRSSAPPTDLRGKHANRSRSQAQASVF